jgi:hypothetical protein
MLLSPVVLVLLVFRHEDTCHRVLGVPGCGAAATGIHTESARRARRSNEFFRSIHLSLALLATRACEVMTNQPGASNGEYGVEYCALHYYSPSAKGFMLSSLSDIRSDPNPTSKSCELPMALDDPDHEDAIILGGAHTHPYHMGGFSPDDLAAEWRPVRFASKNTDRVWDRELLLFLRDAKGECRAYSYNNYSRIISALRDGKWIRIGEVYDDTGNLRMDEGMGWLP